MPFWGLKPDFSKTKFTPEALYRLVEIYFSLGMIKDAKKTTAVLAYNYPKSEWYKNAYNLTNPNQMKKKSNFFKKVINIF